MAKKPKQPPVPTLTLSEIEGLTATQAADEIGHRYTARTRIYVEMGKLIYHLEHRAKMPRGQTIYGILQARGVPESSVNNARLVAHFINNLVAPGHVAESRADDILTFRIANQAHRILSGKTPAKLTAEEIAAIVNDGEKAAIGDELDCLAEHGLTIAAKEEADRRKAAEDERLRQQAAAAEAAEAAAAEAAASAKPATETPPAAQPEVAAAGPVAEEMDETEEPPVVVDTTRGPNAERGSANAEAEETPRSDFRLPASSRSGPALADILADLEEVQLASFDLDAAGLASVREKLAEWTALIDSTLAEAPKREVALAA